MPLEFLTPWQIFVQTVAQSAPTAPLRLATICLDDAGVRRRLDEWHDELELVRGWRSFLDAPERFLRHLE